MYIIGFCACPIHAATLFLEDDGIIHLLHLLYFFTPFGLMIEAHTDSQDKQVHTHPTGDHISLFHPHKTARF